MRYFRFVKFRYWIHLAVSDGTPGKAFKAAIIVGTILNLINQHENIINFANVNYHKILLTYIVPYLVVTYGAVTTKDTNINNKDKYNL
jgi:hypothetical protein